MVVVGNLNSDGPKICNQTGVGLESPNTGLVGLVGLVGGIIGSLHNVKSGQLIGPVGSVFIRANVEEVGCGHDALKDVN